MSVVEPPGEAEEAVGAHLEVQLPRQLRRTRHFEVSACVEELLFLDSADPSKQCILAVVGTDASVSVAALAVVEELEAEGGDSEEAILAGVSGQDAPESGRVEEEIFIEGDGADCLPVPHDPRVGVAAEEKVDVDRLGGVGGREVGDGAVGVARGHDVGAEEHGLEGDGGADVLHGQGVDGDDDSVAVDEADLDDGGGDVLHLVGVAA